MSRLRTCLLLGLLALPISAAAQQDPEREAAIQLATQGQELFAAGEFPEAAERFRQAYARFPEPSFLMSEAVAWFKADDCDRSLARVEGYLRRLPDPPTAERSDLSKIEAVCAVRSGHANLAAGDLAAAERDLDAAVQADTFARAPDEIEELRSAIEQARVARVPDDATPPPKVEPPEKSGGGRTIAGWSLVGAGVASAAGYLLVWNGHREDASQYQACAPTQTGACDLDRAQLDALRPELLTAWWAQVGLGVAATVFTATGVALLVWPAGESTEVGLTSDGGGIGAQVKVRF